MGTLLFILEYLTNLGLDKNFRERHNTVLYYISCDKY